MNSGLYDPDYWRRRYLAAKTRPPGETVLAQLERARAMLIGQLVRMQIDGSPLYEAAEQLEDVVTVLNDLADRLRKLEWGG